MASRDGVGAGTVGSSAVPAGWAARHDMSGMGGMSVRLLMLFSASICILQAHGSCCFSLRVFPQGLSIRGSTKNYLRFSI